MKFGRGPYASGWSGSQPPAVQDPSALACGCGLPLLLYNATLIYSAAVTQAGPLPDPVSEHVNRSPIPLLSTSSPIPALPLKLRPGFVRREDS